MKTIEPSTIRRILVRATNWVGDMVVSLPALRAVRDHFPESEITVLARTWVVPLIEHHPSVDRIIAISRETGPFAGIREFRRALGMVRRTEFDLAVLFQNAFEAALLTWAGGVDTRVGYNVDGRGFLLTHPVRPDDRVKRLHQVEYYIFLLRAMGWEGETGTPVLHVGEKDVESVHSLLSREGIGPGDEVIGLSPGAIYGPAKRWPAERFAAIGDRAVERWGSRVIILGSSREGEICGSVAGAMKHPSLNLCGRTTLGQAMALIRRCHFFVTNDSGLMHVAAALDVPMVAIFGSTDHVATGPLSNRARIVRIHTECSPCLRAECPTDFQCMLGIEPGHVWRELEMMKERMG